MGDGEMVVLGTATVSEEVMDVLLDSESRSPASSGHFIKKCSECNAVIAQCRCMSRDKIVTYEVCAKCAKEIADGKSSADVPTE